MSDFISALSEAVAGQTAAHMTALIQRVTAEASRRMEWPLRGVDIKAEGHGDRPLKWQVIISYYDRAGTFQCQVKNDESLTRAVAECIEKCPAAPDLEAILGI